MQQNIESMALFFQLMALEPLLCQQIRFAGGARSRDQVGQVYTHLA